MVPVKAPVIRVIFGLAIGPTLTEAISGTANIPASISFFTVSFS